MENFWAPTVPLQSMPLMLLGDLAVSISLASMSTCLVGVSRVAIKPITASSSFSVVLMMSWLVRGSPTTELRFERVVLTMLTRLLGSAYLSWTIFATSGSSALGSLTVTRAILDFGSLLKARP